MSTENKNLVPAKITESLATRDTEEIGSFTRTSEFLPQVRVYGGSSDIVKEGKFPIGHFGLYLAADNIIDLGEQFDCLNIDWRPRASIVTGDSPISFFGKYEQSTWVFSSAFTEIKEQAMSKMKGYLAGLEFLLWIPAINKFGLFFMGNPTLRRESPNMKSLTGKGVTLKTKLIKTTGYTWHGAAVFECTTPFKTPEETALMGEVAKFRNPQDSPVEFAKDSQEETRAR